MNRSHSQQATGRRRRQRSLALAAVVAIPLVWSATAALAQDEQPRSFADALRQGSPLLNLRYRYEEVSDDAVGDKHATASTLRTAVGYKTAKWKGLTLLVEAEDVTVIGNESYRNGGFGHLDNGIRDRPVVADPAGTEINQAYLKLDLHDTSFTLGMSEIALGDERFVGPVGWRQNHQSLDAASIANTSLDHVRFYYAFVGNVNRINGGNDDMSSHLLNVDVELGASGKLYLYGYLLDYTDPSRWNLSTTTLGARFTGERKLSGKRAFSYEAAYAQQDDAADNPGRVDADYLNLVLGYGVPKVRVRAGFELLDGGPGKGQFQTPLATLHKFNGWADKFLVTPANGLEDLSLQVDGRPGPFGWVVWYHDFQAATGGASYGSELDLQFTYRAPWGQLFAVKGAFYDADEFAADTDKVMLFTVFSL